MISRSLAIEKLLRDSLEKERYCVILAGGPSKNLWVKELSTFRPLVKINGITLIEHILSEAIKSGYRKILVAGSKELNTAIFNVVGNGKHLGCDVIYVNEKEPKNTANTLSLAKDYVKDTFLFIPCDHFFDFDLKKLEKIHEHNNFAVTLAIYGGAKSDHKTAMVELDGNDITNYWEFPESRETNLISTLIGFAEPEIFNMIPNSSASLQGDVCVKLVSQKKLGGVLLRGNFVNVHTKKEVDLIKTLRGNKR